MDPIQVSKQLQSKLSSINLQTNSQDFKIHKNQNFIILIMKIFS